MTYNEYKKIINDALADYCSNGGSLLNIAFNDFNKEYIFVFDEILSEDDKQNLCDKAHQAMQKGIDLPPGMRLVKVVFK